MNKKKILKWLLIIGFATGLIVFLFVKYFAATDLYRDLTTPKGESIRAIELVKSYQINESHSDSLYNGKMIEVSGNVKESKIENGKTTVMLQSADSTAGVYFVLKDSTELLKTGTTTTLKGLCTGFLGDVQFNEGVIINK